MRAEGTLFPPEIIDEEARPDQVVEALHDRAGEEQHELPLLDEDHLALDVQCLVDILMEMVFYSSLY